MTAIVLHLYYHDLWEEFKTKITPLLSETVHLFVTVTEEGECTEDIKKYAKEVFLVKNVGVDIGPFVFVYGKIQQEKYKYIVKLHTKKSLHSIGRGEMWRKTLVHDLVRSPEHFSHVIGHMDSNPNLFMAGSNKYFKDRIKEPYTHPNRVGAVGAINKINTFLNVDDHGCFFAGSMFIVTTNYLDKLFSKVDLMSFYNEFNEGYSLGGTLAHGLERVIGYGVETYNGKYLTI